MVLPFPTEIWLDILKGLAKEGEYDTVERCRVVCSDASEVRRWRGPRQVTIHGEDSSEDDRGPIPHLATFASRHGGRWPSVDALTISNAVWRAADLDADAVFRDLFRFSISRLSLDYVVFPTILTLGRLACLWSAVRTLHLSSVIFPSVATFSRLLPCTFAKHGVRLRSMPVHPTLPSGLVVVELMLGFSLHSDPRSVADLVDFFIATGTSTQLRDITISSTPSFQMMTQSDVCLNRLVKYSGQSLRRLSLDPTMIPPKCLQSMYKAPYLNLSDNGCLEQLDLTVKVTDENDSCLCTPVIEVLSQVTSTHISRITVQLHPYDFPHASIDVDLGTLIEELPQLDAVLSRPVFGNLIHVAIDVGTLDRPNVRDEEWAEGLILRLPTLDERGVLGCVFHALGSLSRIGVHWDSKASAWKRYGVERGAIQDVVITDEVVGVEDEREPHK
ncbi:hypothetical protein IEO21_03901 [Rhodonia placenta]|uniref:Uncharacterized protein n=1 Tax=Rhodonia placenta TaxID=104341 RepID=A0A8H7P4S0_9APHY|nr:hypothetical protein IEO21_03901 [Postia placenta]